MKICSRYWHTLFAFLACIAAPVVEAEFVALENSPQAFNTIQLGLLCPSDSFGKEVNRIAWTIIPVTGETSTRSSSSATTISTQPANLVDAVVENGVLKFSYNSVSLMQHTTEGTGVKIYVPADQVYEITTIGAVFYAKVHTGFTSLKQITSKANAASLHFAWDNVAPVNFEASGSAVSATILGNVGFFNLSGNAHVVQILGNVKGGVISTNAAAITIDGIVQEQLTVSGYGNAITAADCSRIVIPIPFINVCYPLVGVTLEQGPWEEALTETRVCGSG